MTYAWYMHLDHETRDRLHRLGCTASGWIHAGGGPPWTVLVADTVDEAHAAGIPYTAKVMPYTGREPTTHVREWMDAKAGPGFFDSIMEQAKPGAVTKLTSPEYLDPLRYVLEPPA